MPQCPTPLLGRDLLSTLGTILRLGGPKQPLILTLTEPDLGFPGGSVVKNPPAMQKTWVQSLGLENPLEKEMETHSSNLAWKIPWTEEPGRLQSMGLQRVKHN